MNKPDLLIQIEVSRSKESTDCEFSTGYPIGRDRIITAAHVLNQEFKSPYIEAFFRDPEHPGSYLCSTCEIVWDGRKDRGPDAAVDVAVLRCQLPDKFAAEIPVLEQAPLALVKAHAQGYPAITRKGKRQSPLAAFGEFAPIPTGQMEIELHCSDALRDTQNWKGVSGAPVFVEDHFAGIIYEYRRTHRFDHFGAIAIFRLLEDEQFQIAIGWPDSKDEAYRRKTQAGIKARLKKLSGQVEDDYEDRTILDWLLQKLG